MEFNSWWYLGLIVLSLIIQIFIYIKVRRIRFMLFHFAMMAVGYTVDMIIYIFGNGYMFYPKIIDNNAFYDGNVGGIISDVFIVPSLAGLISVFNLNWLWMCFFAAFLYLVEWLFTELNIYVQNWWKTWYTTFGLIFVYFPLGKYLYKKISKPLQGTMHSVILYLVILSLLGLIHMVPIMWLSNRSYLPGWYQDPAQDTTAFAALYQIFVSVIMVILVKIRWGHRWMKYLYIFGITSLITLVLKMIGILHSYVWWDPWFYILIPAFFLKAADVMSKSLAKGDVSAL